MKITEIKNTVENLVRYEDSEITHTFNDAQYTFSLTYSKEEKTFQLKNMETGNTDRYEDLESTAMILDKIINPNTQKAAEK